MNETILLGNLSNINTKAGMINISSLSPEQIITQYCYDFTKNNKYLLIFMVTLWLSRYILKQIIKRKYVKNHIVVPNTINLSYEILDETVDLLQSTYILIMLILMYQ